MLRTALNMAVPYFVLACLLSLCAGQGTLLDGLGNVIQKEVGDVLTPIAQTVIFIGSSGCEHVKKITGVSYEQIDGEKEPDVNNLTLEYKSKDYQATYNINTAAEEIPKAPFFNPNQFLYIFIHGFTADPDKPGSTGIRDALLAKDQANVLALDASSLIGSMYLRSTTYVRFIGEKLGDVLAAMVNAGVSEDKIHIMGHSLGAHIGGFCGKRFTQLTGGKKVRRISGLDPANPCFGKVDENLRLKATDAFYVDVCHTDAGIYGLPGPIGHADYYPNSGSQQPGCSVPLTCSHSRVVDYYKESIKNETAFPALKCASWEAFKKGQCDGEISYMGFPSAEGTRGLFYLQTNAQEPYGKGLDGTKYKNDNGIIGTLLN